jgi:hypothetical protein
MPPSIRLGSGGLHHPLRTPPAGVFGPPGDQDLEAGRGDVEPLGHVLADDVHGPAAAWAGAVLGFEHDLLARQLRRQSAAIGPARDPGAFGTRSIARRLLQRGLGSGDGLLQVLQRQRQLVGIEHLRAAAEAVSLQRLDDQPQPRDLAMRPVPLLGRPLGQGPCRHELDRVSGPLGQEQGTQCVGVLRQGLGCAHRRIRAHQQRFVAPLRPALSHRVARLLRRLGCRHPAGLDPPPIQTLEKSAERRAAQPHGTVGDARPGKPALLKPLGQQHRLPSKEPLQRTCGWMRHLA